MLPDNELSGKARIAGFSFPVKQPVDFLVDWELAGVGLNNPDQGLLAKLWTLEAKPNDDTGQIDVIVSAPGGVAPGEPSRVLFSGVDITEVALAFDQNMNPFVAYMQGGDAKIYWFDSTVSSMVHTTLPSGCYDLRCTLDDKRNFNVAESDIVLGYIRDGNLCIRYQRDRYTIEYVLRSGIGGNARLVSMAMNKGSRMQFRLRNYALTDDPGALLQADPFLADVVADLLRRSNVPPEYIDTDQLWVPIEGYRIANEGGADSNIAPLQQAWFFDPGEWDKKLRFIMRGAEPVAHITFSDLLERQGNNGPMQMERVQEIELLRKVNLTTVDSTAGWIGSKQTAERRSATIKATGESSTILPITMHPDFAATIATKRLRIPWGEPHKFRYGLGVPWSMLTPTDVITYEDTLGRVHQIRLGQIEEDYGSFQYESTTNARWIYDLTATGTSAPPWIPTTPGQAGDTVLEIINAPVNREADDELGLYIAARGTGSAWSGGVLLVSTDGGANYVQAATLDAPATIGETESAMSGSATTVDVVVPDPLESVTDDQIAAGNNRAFIGDEEVQFKTATLTLHDDDGYHYTLSDMVRNVLRTTAVAHSAGSRFVLFDDAVVFMLVGRTFYDTDVKYKAVTNGQNADDVAEVTYHLKPMYSQIEWAVGDVVVAPNEAGAGVVVTWTPAPRIGKFGPSPYESKYFRGYRLKFGDGFNVDVPPGTTSYVYEDAYDAGGTVTVEIWSLNEITGEGALAGGFGGDGGGEEPGGGDTPPPVTISATGGPASTAVGPNGGFPDNAPYPIPQPDVLGTNVIDNGDFSSPGLADWKKQNGSALDSRWSNTGGKLRYEGTGSGDMAAYYYGAFYSVPIWPFARYTFTVSGKVQCLTAGTKVALGVARGFSTTGGGIPSYGVDTITDFAEYVSETTISKAYTHVIDVAGKTADGRYVIGTFMPVLIVRSTTGETQVVTLDDASMVVTEYMPAMTEVVLDNIDFPADDQTGWTRFPYVSGMSAELSFADGFVSMAPTDQYAVHSYMFNLDKLNNHVSWAAGHRIRIKWKSWCNDPTAFNYITTNGSAACISLRASGDPPPDFVPGWQAALMRGDYTTNH